MEVFPIIAKLGGREAAHERLRACGFGGSIHALRMWGVRQSIPGEAIVHLLRIAEADRIETCAADFEPVNEAAE